MPPFGLVWAHFFLAGHFHCSYNNIDDLILVLFGNYFICIFMQGINGILADEMGLGKTVQSIAFLAHIAEEYGKCLVAI